MSFKSTARALLPPRAESTGSNRYTVLIGRGIVRIFDSLPEDWWSASAGAGLWRYSRGKRMSAASRERGGWPEPIELFPPGVHYLN